ncbi:MAG: S49 family peptidase [Pseudomonadota bacterium]
MLKRLWYKLPFTGTSDPVVARVALEGVIAPESRTKKALSFSGVEKALLKAFAVPDAKAVVLTINSPGGSPTQSRMIHDRVRALSKKEKVPVITYIEDVGASGGYMLALAGEEIFADPYAIVGSIGVIAGGFGFTGAIEKLGVERRVHTAGKNKSQLDPFRPEEQADITRLKGLLDKTHTLFVQMVKDRRGGRLSEDDETIFNGNFWLAGDANELGLIDRTGDLRELLQERFGENVKIQTIETEKKGLLTRLLGARSVSLIDPSDMIAHLERSVQWTRFGR